MNHRIVKFRGKRVDNGKWVYGYPYFIWEEGVAFIINNCKSLHLTQEDSTFTGIEVIPETICEYTGIRDWYEDDILGEPVVGEEDEVIGFIKFDTNLAAFIIEKTNGGWEYLSKHIFDHKNNKKIGDLYSNPKLINK